MSNDPTSQLLEQFSRIRVEVVQVPSRANSWLMKQNPFMFLSIFDSPIGIELLDIRGVALMNVKKSEQLIALIEKQGPEVLGQWGFHEDDTQLCNVTFGVQLPLGVEDQTLLNAIEFVQQRRNSGEKLLKEFAETGAAHEGVQFVRPTLEQPSTPLTKYSRDTLN
jgi:hypothetical protein